MISRIIFSTYDPINKTMNIKFFDGETIEIELENDVVFTNFVKRLCQLIQDRLRIEILNEDATDPKLQIVQDTVNKIIDSFNVKIEEYLEETSVAE